MKSEKLRILTEDITNTESRAGLKGIVEELLEYLQSDEFMDDVRNDLMNRARHQGIPL